MKRSRALESSRLHYKYEIAFRGLKTERAAELAKSVDSRYALGAATRAGSCPAQASEAKRQFADAVVLLRVGEFYECFGADAVIVVEFAKTTSVTTGVPRTSFRQEKVQEVLDTLVEAGWQVAVHEESRVLVTPRQRVFTQLVCEANPVYAHSKSPSMSAATGKSMVALHRHGVDVWDVAACDVADRTVVLYAGVMQAVAESFASRAAAPVLCVREVPAFARAEGMETLIMGGTTHVVDRLLDYVSHTLHVPRDSFRQRRAQDNACVPPPRFTLVQLGIDDPSQSTPSLVDACLPLRALAPVRAQMTRWLSHPPAYARIIANVVETIQYTRKSLPSVRAVRRGRWRACAGLGGESTIEDFTVMRVNASALLWALGEDGTTPSYPLSELARCVAAELHLDLAALCINRLWEAADSVVDDDGFREDVVSVERDALSKSLAVRDEFTSSLPEASWSLVDGVRIGMYGTRDAALKLACVDRNGRIVQGRYCTVESMGVDDAVEHAREALDVARARALATASRSVCDGLQAEACVVESWACEVATIVDHVRACHKWIRADLVDEPGESTVLLHGLRPYWIPSGQRNDVHLRAGTPAILTGPNGGGKSTLLRSVGAACLLAQCGLLVPCELRARVVRFGHIFLRAGAADCAAERKSSFASEMADVRTMIASRDALVLMDEPCRGTATADGVPLLESILSHMPQSATTLATTHFHELRGAACEWLQLTTRVDDTTAECTPVYIMTPGRNTESLALRVALAAGLPVDVVHEAAREARDVHTLVLSALRRVGAPTPLRLPSPQAIVPPSYRSVLYVIITVDDTVYVGETDRIADRLKRHARDKEAKIILTINCDDKTHARTLETLLLRELSFTAVTLMSLADASHVV